MRTTIDIEDDVLFATKELAKKRGTTVGRVLSELVRHSLTKQTSVATRGGLPLFPVQSKAGLVTLELVNRLRDETP